jgi:hypothetical protein
LQISKQTEDGEPKYYICLDTNLMANQILSIYEDRWNLETAHREANKKLGFKGVSAPKQTCSKRFKQLVFAIWTEILLVEVVCPPTNNKNRTLG